MQQSRPRSKVTLLGPKHSEEGGGKGTLKGKLDKICFQVQ